MRCPICKKDAAPGYNPFRPFCTERCKLIDLDNWLSGRYRVPVPIRDGDRDNEGALTDDTSFESQEKADFD